MALKYTISVENRFDFLSEAYKIHFERADETAFQSPLWLDLIHKILMPALEARQYTIVIRSEDNGQLQAVFPFIMQKAIMGMKIIGFADFGVCDYNAIIGQKAVLEKLATDKAVLESLHNILKDKITGQGHLLLIRKVREDSFDVSRFFKNMTKVPNDSATHNCHLGDDVKAWQQQNFSKSWLKNQRRRERKFIREIGSWVFAEVKDEDQQRKAMTVIAQMHQKRFDDNLIQHDIYKKFYTDYIAASTKTGEAIMYSLTLKDEIIAVEFGFLYKTSYQGILVAAQTEQYSKFSLGYQMIFKVIEDIADRGYHDFDLGIGNQSYKQKFNAVETRLYDYSLALSASGKVIAPIYHYSKPLKNILKKYMPHVH